MLQRKFHKRDETQSAAAARQRIQKQYPTKQDSSTSIYLEKQNDMKCAQSAVAACSLIPLFVHVRLFITVTVF